MIVLYDKDATSFTSLGIGVLTDFKNIPTITEVLKGEYILEFEYLKNGKYSEFLDERNIVKALGQAFRIENIKPSKDGYKILARHIVFDLRDNYLVNVAPTNKTAQEALEWILDRACFQTNFTVTGDCTKLSSAKYIRMNVDEALFSADNSVLSRFGGEPEYDNYHIILHNHRGKDTGIEIRERKNLTGFEMNKDLSTVKTRIMPIGSNELLLPEQFIDSPLINSYQNPKIGKINVNVSVDEETAEEEAFEVMRKTVMDSFNNGLDKPTISIKVDFIELSKTEEYKKYKNLETISLGDTLKFRIPSLNQSFPIRVIKTVKNAFTGRITNLELGNEIPTFITAQKQNNQAIKEQIVGSTLDQAKTNATNLINHPFNGHLMISKETGELYIMDTTDMNTAKNIWKWGLGGVGFSKNGINGPFETAWTKDGEFVADFITTGKLSTSVIDGYDELELNVSKKVDKKDFTAANIFLKINNDESEAGINADKILLSANDILNIIAGNELNLSTKNISIVADNFSVDKTGYSIIKKGRVANFDIVDNKLSSSVILNYDYNQNDIEKVRSYIVGTTTLTNEEFIKYDLNHDGKVDAMDFIRIFHIIDSGISKSNPGKFEINTSPDDLSIFNFYDGTGNLKYYIGYWISKLKYLETQSLTTNSINAGNIDSGRCTLTSSGNRTIYFNKTFDTVPNVVLTPLTSTNGVIAAKMSEITTTYFTANIGGTNFGDNQFCWIAIAD